MQIVVDGEAGSPTVGGRRAARAALAERRIFGEPAEEASPGGDLVLVTVPVAGDPLSSEAVAAVRELPQRSHPGRLRRR